jgi:DUF based on E. rectale Gene description (DUF3880)
MIVIYNSNYIGNRNSYLTYAVAEAAREVFGRKDVVIADNRSLVPLAATGFYEFLVCVDGQRLYEPLLRRARPSFSVAALWAFEDPFMLDYNVSNSSMFDYVFTNDPACVAAYNGKGHYLPLAASKTFHFRAVKADAKLEYDIFFAGTMWPNRVDSIRGTSNNEKSFRRIDRRCVAAVILAHNCREYAVFGAPGARLGRAAHTPPYAVAIRSSVTSRRML